MRERTILFCSYYFHPKHVTATRNYYLAKMLAEQGVRVHVITNLMSPGIKNALSHLPITIHEVEGLDYRWVLRKMGFKDGITSNRIKPGKFIEWAHAHLLDFPWNITLGEGGGIYYRKAIKLALKIIENDTITHIFSSYRPLADHFIAYQVKQKYSKLIWVADFRDVLWWRIEDPRYQKKWLQKMLLATDYMTTVTDGIGKFWDEISKRNSITLYNGIPEVYKGVDISKSDKFIINYTGKIFTQFQHADYLFKSIREFIEENKISVDELSINYSGIHHEFWNSWMAKEGLLKFSNCQSQTDIESSWYMQKKASINLLLTWCNDSMSGFIHGKFNEYLAARKPIFCLVHGERDKELESIYSNLINSALFYNDSSEVGNMKSFLTKNYKDWKIKPNVELLPEKILDAYAWQIKGKPLLEILNA